MKKLPTIFNFPLTFWISILCLNSGIYANKFKEPSFENPTSQLATENQFYSPDFRFWCNELKTEFTFHRKLWEWCYILQVLYKHHAIAPGKKGLGFGVGIEPLPAVLAKHGCEIVATDQDYESALEGGWVKSDQHLSNLNALNCLQICPTEEFNHLVSLKTVDMRNIADDLKEFDFVWSSCSFEHLGNIKEGLNFVKNSLKCLKKGGIAVHTTEFNVSSNQATIDHGGVVLYRKKDLRRLAHELTAEGYTVLPLNFHLGNGKFDHFVDVPPYAPNHKNSYFNNNNPNVHLKLRVLQYTTTSVGIVIIK